jgi:hypothetical protein
MRKPRNRAREIKRRFTPIGAFAFLNHCVEISDAQEGEVMKRLFTVCFIFLGLSSPFSAIGVASEKQVELHWSQLGIFLRDGNMLNRGKAMLVLPDSKIVEGQITAVRTEVLMLNVTESSDKKVHPRGMHSIPKSSVATIRYIQNKGILRHLGMIGGIGGGIVLDVAVCLKYCTDQGRQGGLLIGMLAIPAGTGTAGYLAGRASDHKVIIIKVVPD